jgi:enoyl-CoA hydratase
MSLLDIHKERGVITLTLNDPERRNLLSGDLCRLIIDAVTFAENDPQARALVVRGNGKAFCAGANLEDLKAASAGDTEAVNSVYEAFMCIANASLPTIAVVEGAAVGAGMNLALACDLRIASEQAWFDTRFMQIGLHPGGGHAWMLQRAVGWQMACNLLLLGQTLDAAAAERSGLVVKAFVAAELENGLSALLSNVVTAPRELLLSTKKSMRLAVIQSHEEAMEHETDWQMWSLQQPAFMDLVSRLQGSLGK